MCGRFTQHYPWREIVALYRLTRSAINLQPRYNIAPTTIIDVVIPRGGDRLELVPMRWGLIPSWWKKTAKEAPSTFNARAETVARKPMFRAAFKRSRCVIPASGYYEWVRREVVCVIVRRRHPAEPAVPSAVPYEVRRFANGPSKSPRTMYPTVLRRVSNPRGDDISASIRRTGARVDGTVSVSKPLKVSSSMKGPKMLSGPQVRSVRVLHSRPSWATQAAGI